MGINMEIQIMEHMEDALKVLIQCRKADAKVLRLKALSCSTTDCMPKRTMNIALLIRRRSCILKR